jgi:hypothetical protein
MKKTKKQEKDVYGANPTEGVSIISNGTSAGSIVLLNGKRLDGVTKAVFTIDAGSAAVDCHLEMFGTNAELQAMLANTDIKFTIVPEAQLIDLKRK